MARNVRPRKAKVGLSPGTLVYTGSPVGTAPRITLFSYDPDRLVERRIESPDELGPLLAGPGFHWLNVDGVHDTGLVASVGSLVNAHPLALEDVVTPGQRPKIEEFDEVTFVVAREVTYDRELRQVESEQICILLTDRILVTFQEREGDVFGPVRDRLRGGAGRLRRLGPEYLAYALLDVIVDQYFVVLEALGDEIDALEDDVLDPRSPEVQPRLRAVRGNLVHVRRACWPARDVLATVARNDSPRFSSETRLFARDAHDHAVQVAEVVESLRDVVNGLSDLHMASLSRRMNETMKVLTVISTLFIPLSFIAGVYGMNFVNMPELVWPYGYAFSLGLMAATATGLLLFFRNRRWI